MSSRAFCRTVQRVFAGSAGGETWMPAYEHVRAKLRAGELPTESDWRRVSLENGRTEQEASAFAREIVPAFEAYRAEILAEASAEDVVSLLRSFRID